MLFSVLDYTTIYSYSMCTIGLYAETKKKPKKEELVNKLSEIYLLMFWKTYDGLSKNKLSLKDGIFFFICTSFIPKVSH